METNKLTPQQQAYCDKIYSEQLERVQKFCAFKLSSHPDEIEDTVSEVFCEFCNTIGIGIAVRNPQAWLLKVAGNIISKKYGEISESRKKLINLEDVQNQLSYEINFDIKRISDVVVDAVFDEVFEELEKDEQELLNLVAFDKMKYKVIAEKLDTTEAAIKERVYRLKAKIKELAKEKFEKI